MSDLPPLPAPFVERLIRILPADRLASCLVTFASAKVTTLRANTLQTEVEAVAAELVAGGLHLTPVPWLAEAFTVPQDERRRLTETEAFAAGRIYVQNLASMVPPLVLDPQPGEEVLDLAAAPGSKTLQMAAALHGTGRLVAVESVRGRYFRLKTNLRQHGAGAVEAYLMDGRAAGRRWPERFDRILLDAPCSSEARFSQLEPESWAHWSLRKVRETAHKQRGLLQAAYAALRPGGILLYCTCSFAPEENELAVDWLLRRHGGELEALPVTLPFSNTQPGLTCWDGRELDHRLAASVRILPDDVMEGFFLCLLRKR